MNIYNNSYGRNSQKNNKNRENPDRGNQNWDNFNRYLRYQRVPGQYYPMNYPYWYFPMWYYPQGQHADNHEAYPNPYSYGFPFPAYPNKNPNAENAKPDAPAGNTDSTSNESTTAAANNVNMPDTSTTSDVSNEPAPAANPNNVKQTVLAAETVKTEEDKKTQKAESYAAATEKTAEAAANQEQNTEPDDLVRNVVEYLNAVETAYIQFEAGDSTNLWFRGSESDTYTLLPPVARKPYNINSETTFMSLFKPKSAPYISENQEINLVYNNDSFIAALFLMQRAGIPTRLLSWTEDALAALFFAVNNVAGETENPVVWCLNPVKLNTTYKFNDTPGYIPNAAEKKVTEIFGSDKNSGLLKPGAVYSPFLSPDIIAQKETFTIFPFNTELKPLEALPDSKDYLFKITIDKSMSDTIASQLKRYGFSKELLIRGLETVAENIKNEDQT